MKNGLLALILGLMACHISGQEQGQKNLVRKKRLVYGKFIPKYKTYKVLYYQAAITDGIQPGLKNCWALYSATERPGKESVDEAYVTPCLDRINIKCGGSLITSSAVQTSCHCLSSQVMTSKRRLKAVKNVVSVWETYSIVHIGALRMIDMTAKTARFSKRYYIHEHCLPLMGPIWINDFGLIILDRRATHPDGSRWKLAPLYLTRDLKFIWTNATSYEWVCMHVGFGHTAYSDGVYGNRARTMFYSWRLIANRNWCSDFHRGAISADIRGEEKKMKILGNDYFEVKKPAFEDLAKLDDYACSRHLGRYKEIPAYADAGHAVTCSDMYFSVQGFSTSPDNLTGYGVGFSMPLIYDPLVNAAEYRRVFAEFVETGKIKPKQQEHSVLIKSNGSVPGFLPYQIVNTGREWDPVQGYINKREVNPLEAMDFVMQKESTRTKPRSIAVRLFNRSHFVFLATFFFFCFQI